MNFTARATPRNWCASGRTRTSAAPSALPCCALTANRNRKRSRIVCGCVRSSALTDRPTRGHLLVTGSMSAITSGVMNNSTETDEPRQATEATSEGHGEPSQSNPATDWAIDGRVGSVSYPNHFLFASADLLIGTTVSGRVFGGAQ